MLSLMIILALSSLQVSFPIWLWVAVVVMDILTVISKIINK